VAAVTARRVFAPDDGIVDDVAVDRVLNGHPAELTRTEALQVVRRHVLEREGTLKDCADVLGISLYALNNLLADVDQRQLLDGRTFMEIADAHRGKHAVKTTEIGRPWMKKRRAAS